jgi:hypothetical protein
VLCCARFVRSYSPYTRVFSRFLLFDPLPPRASCFFWSLGVCLFVGAIANAALASVGFSSRGRFDFAANDDQRRQSSSREPWVFLPLNRENEPFACRLIDLRALRAAIRPGRGFVGFGGSQGVSVRFGGKEIFPPYVRVLSQLQSLRFFAARGRNKIRPFRWRISLLIFSLQILTASGPLFLSPSACASFPWGFGQTAVLRWPVLGLWGFLLPVSRSPSRLGNVGVSSCRRLGRLPVRFGFAGDLLHSLPCPCGGRGAGFPASSLDRLILLPSSAPFVLSSILLSFCFVPLPPCDSFRLRFSPS